MTILEQRFVEREPLTVSEMETLIRLLIAERDAWLENARQFEKANQKLWKQTEAGKKPNVSLSTDIRPNEMGTEAFELYKTACDERAKLAQEVEYLKVAAIAKENVAQIGKAL